MKECQQDCVIIGFDPGTLVTGFGVIELKKGEYTPLDYGCIRPPVHLSLSERYEIIFDAANNLIEKYKPSVCVLEMQYVYKNPQSALKLGMSTGILLIAAKKKLGMRVFGYTPKEAKKAVTGNGGSPKSAVQMMVKHLLGLKELPQPEDASDALSLAICFAHHEKFQKPHKEL